MAWRRPEVEVVRDYIVLMKPRVIWLLILSSLIGYAVAASPNISWTKMAELAVVGLLSTGGSAAFNQYWERDIDARMGRTSSRPLPSGRLRPGAALAYSLAVSLAGLALSWIWLGPPATAAVAAGWLIYTAVYTVLLKRRHWSNILWGGFAGNAAYLSGWLAVRPMTLDAFLESMAIYIWIPAHIWSLAYVYRDEYREAGVPMLTAMLPRDKAISLIALLDAAAAAYMWALAYALSGLLGALVMAPAAAAAVLLGLLAFREKSDRAFWRVFKISSPLLTFFLVALLV
ncbi:MAG: protoheme IX farnesyltransferase [Thermoproteus sp. JCHS_4]|jgi:protoheme IX farnesyltransferase|nr:MAG: protoheme IX farnesyltransferase [Thermoproteus sp. JCHS_4]